MMTDKEIVDELKSHLNLCSGTDIICKVKELEKEKDEFKKGYEDKHNYSCELGDFIDKQKIEKDKLKEENDKLKFFNRDCKEETERFMEKNEKLIDEIECMNSTWETKEKEYEAELKDKDTIIEYLNTQIDKYKKLFGEIKKETDKAKEIKGIMINEDKTKIDICGVELSIGDKFTIDNTSYTLKEIYIGKSSKISLRTDKNTIRLGNKFINGKVKIVKEIQ